MNHKKINIYLLILTGILFFTSPVKIVWAEESNQSIIRSTSIKENEDENESELKPSDVEGAIVHEVIYPEKYKKNLPKIGKKLNYAPNSLLVSGYEFPYVDMKGNTGSEDDFTKLNEILDQNQVAMVGDNRISSFFGHYYDLTGNGIFNALVDYELLDEGSEIIVTDSNGCSRGYEVSQIISFNIAEQDLHFYGDDLIRQLAYHGNEDDMVYIQYCRWDIALGNLVSAFAYRVW